jgi:UDP-2,3-diacylglucosamine pyrophosphatase LpxH
VAARLAHNQQVEGSNPSPATNKGGSQMLWLINKLRRLSDREFKKLITEIARVNYAKGFHDAHIEKKAAVSNTGCIIGAARRDIEDIMRKSGL